MSRGRRFDFEHLKESIRDFTLLETIEIWHEAQTGTFADIDEMIKGILDK